MCLILAVDQAQWNHWMRNFSKIFKSVVQIFMVCIIVLNLCAALVDRSVAGSTVATVLYNSNCTHINSAWVLRPFSDENI